MVHDEHSAASHRGSVVGVQLQVLCRIQSDAVAWVGHSVVRACRPPSTLRWCRIPEGVNIHANIVSSACVLRAPHSTCLFCNAEQAVVSSESAGVVTAQEADVPDAASLYVHTGVPVVLEPMTSEHFWSLSLSTTSEHLVASVAAAEAQVPGVGAGVGAGVWGGGGGAGDGFSVQTPAGTMLSQYPAAFGYWVVLTGLKQALL